MLKNLLFQKFIILIYKCFSTHWFLIVSIKHMQNFSSFSHVDFDVYLKNYYCLQRQPKILKWISHYKFKNSGLKLSPESKLGISTESLKLLHILICSRPPRQKLHIAWLTNVIISQSAPDAHLCEDLQCN